MRRAYIGSITFIVLVAQAGCARMSATTHVKPDGSYTRIVRFTVSDSSETFGAGLRDTFELPAGTPWTVTKAKTKDETVYEAQQTATCGQTIRQDVALKSEGKSRALTNEVSVRSIGPGRFEYREVLHGPCDRKELEKLTTSLAEVLKAVLPPTPHGDSDRRRVADRMFKETWHSLFGPSEPQLANGMLQPDLAARMMSRRLGPAMKQVLTEVYGDRIPPLKREDALRKLTAYANDMAKSQRDKQDESGKKASKSSSDNGASGLVPLFFAVRCPGKILTSNGLYDETQNEVFWALYPEAAAFDDVVLTATWQVDDSRSTLRPVTTSNREGPKRLELLLIVTMIMAVLYYALRNRNR